MKERRSGIVFWQESILALARAGYKAKVAPALPAGQNYQAVATELHSVGQPYSEPTWF